MNNELYTVEILTPNDTIYFKNRQVRTPAEFVNITKDEVKLLKSQMNTNDLQYTVTLVNKEEAEQLEIPPTSIVFEENEDVIIEDLCDEIEEAPISILDKLMTLNDE